MWTLRGVRQVPLLLILVVDELSRKSCSGVPWKLMTWCLFQTVGIYFQGMEGWHKNKWLCVNICWSGKYPCCLLQWSSQQIHRVLAVQAVGKQVVQRLVDWWRTQITFSPDAHMFGVEVTSCYLGDMLSVGGGCDSATAPRCCVAKLRKLVPLLTTGHLSQWQLHSPLHLWYQKPRRNTLGFTTPNTWHWGYHSSWRLWLFRHVYRVTFWIKLVTDLVIPGTKGRGRLRKR